MPSPLESPSRLTAGRPSVRAKTASAPRHPWAQGALPDILGRSTPSTRAKAVVQATSCSTSRHSATAFPSGYSVPRGSERANRARNRTRRGRTSWRSHAPAWKCPEEVHALRREADRIDLRVVAVPSRGRRVPSVRLRTRARSRREHCVADPACSRARVRLSKLAASATWSSSARGEFAADRPHRR
jgi:hypothetical protein